MQIEAQLSGEELRMAVTALLPIKVLLDEDATLDRHLTLGRPIAATLVENRGLEVTCPAEIRWSNLLDFHLEELVFTVVPTIEAREGRPTLALRLEVRRSDFARLPDLVDSGIAKILDHVLDSYPIVVEVGRFLTHDFALPARVEPKRTVVLAAREASCRVDTSGFRLGATIDVGLAS